MTEALADHLWQSTVFALAAGVLAAALRGNRAHVRHWIWLAASLKFLVPFQVLVTLGSHLARSSVALPTAPAISFAMRPFSDPASSGAAAGAPGDPARAVMLGVWLCGVGALAVMRVRGWRRIRAAARASTPWNVIHVGVQPPRVQIRSSPDLLEPGVVGLWRPMLMLPAGIEDRLTAPQLNAVLAHEWCHIRRWDNLAATIHMIVETAFWFHPLVWWIGARLVDERERACDEHVLQVLKEPRAYAEAILGVCRLYVASPVRCVSGVTGSNLEKRMEDIMSNRVGLGLNFARRTVLALIATLAVATPIAVGILTPAVHAQAQRGTQRKAGPAGTKEAALKDGLFQLRHAIDQYHSAKNAYPPSLDSLVTAGYIKKIPTDPFTNRTDSWQTVPSKRDPKNPTGGGGIFDIRSGSTAKAKDGTKYSEW